MELLSLFVCKSPALFTHKFKVKALVSHLMRPDAVDRVKEGND